MSRNLDIIGYMYNDTKAKIRESIAKEIESLDDKNESYVWLAGYDWGIKQAANIARGIK